MLYTKSARRNDLHALSYEVYTTHFLDKFFNLTNVFVSLLCPLYISKSLASPFCS